jgi:hypothetical protein
MITGSKLKVVLDAKTFLLHILQLLGKLQYVQFIWEVDKKKISN